MTKFLMHIEKQSQNLTFLRVRWGATTTSKTAFGTMTLGIMTLGIMTLGIMTLGIMTLGIMTLA